MLGYIVKIIPHKWTQVYGSTHEVTVSSFCYFLLPLPERNTDVPTRYTSGKQNVTLTDHKVFTWISGIKQQNNHAKVNKQVLKLPLLLLLLACPGGHIEGAYQENQLPACRIWNIYNPCMGIVKLHNKLSFRSQCHNGKWIKMTSGDTRCWLSALINFDQGLRLCLEKETTQDK